MTYTITPTNWQTDQAALRNIRELVFIQEQQVPIADEWDDKDETAIHFLVKSALNEGIACARLLVENHSGKILFHIGRVAVLPDHREQGVGRKLINAVIDYCKKQQPDAGIYLYAQTSRQRFYEHLKFVPQGSVFMDAGIPHIEMWLLR